MYLDFYGFAKKPFELTPDPDFVYLGEKHKEALALLKYGISECKGFILLTGETGTGKTTMVQTLLRYLGPTTRTVYLSNPALSPEDFFYCVGSELGLKVPSGKKGEFIIEFKKLLNECSAARTNIVLIIDEAQDLSFDLLEEIRLLSNMEANPEKMLNIILTGHPELNNLLSSSRCRALLQRISVRYELSPLSRAETMTYIRRRVRASGGPPDLFHNSVANAVCNYSNGYPRLINTICDNTLLLGYSQGQRDLTPEMVHKAYADMKLPVCPVDENRMNGFLSAADEDAAEGVPLGAGYGKDYSMDSRAADLDESREKPLEKRPGQKTMFLTAAILFLSLSTIIAVTLFSRNASSFPGNASSYIISAFTYCRNLFNASDRETVLKPIRQRISHTPASQPAQEADGVPSGQPPGAAGSAEPSYNEAAESSAGSMQAEAHGVRGTERKTDRIPLKEGEPLRSDDNGAAASPGSGDQDHTAFVGQIVRVNKGDTLTTLALKVYGIANDNILKLLQDGNPEIETPDLLAVDQEVLFPGLTEKEIPGRYSVHIDSFDTMSEFVLVCTRFAKSRLHILVAGGSEDRAFMLAMGTFDSLREAQDYARSLLDRGIVDFANPIPLPVISE